MEQTLGATDSSQSSVDASRGFAAMIRGDLPLTLWVYVAQTAGIGSLKTIPVVWPPTLNVDDTASLAAVSGMGCGGSSLDFG